MRKFKPDATRENEVLWGHPDGFEHVLTKYKNPFDLFKDNK